MVVMMMCVLIGAGGGHTCISPTLISAKVLLAQLWQAQFNPGCDYLELYSCSESTKSAKH